VEAAGGTAAPGNLSSGLVTALGVSPVQSHKGALADLPQLGSRAGEFLSPPQQAPMLGMLRRTPDARSDEADAVADSPVPHSALTSPPLTGFREAYSNLQLLSLSSTVKPIPGPALGADTSPAHPSHASSMREATSHASSGLAASMSHASGTHAVEFTINNLNKGKDIVSIPPASTPFSSSTPAPTLPERGALCPLPENALLRANEREKSTSPAVDKPPPKRRPCLRARETPTIAGWSG
jgi:hypothetical protein